MERKVLTIGSFDVPHFGHAYLFKECERYGNLTVGVNSDEFIEQYKGQRPIYEYEERTKLIRMLGYEVVKNTSAGRELVDLVQPDVLVIGGDWARKDYYSQIDVTPDYMDENEITMIYVPRMGTVSTSDIKERLR